MDEPKLMMAAKLVRCARPRRQRGAVAIMVSLVTVILVMMLGLVLDLGRLFVVKTELQNAADACALAAVWEMSPYNDTAQARSIAAGIAVGKLNQVNFQSAPVLDADWEIQFSENPDTGFGPTLTRTSWFVRCRPHGGAGKSIAMWFMGVWGVLAQGQATYSSPVVASAVAGLRPCLFPVAFTYDEANRNAPNRGFLLNHWYSGKLGAKDSERGQFGWLELGGCNNAACLAEQIGTNGWCMDVEHEAVPLKTGNIGDKWAKAWNTRFGLYSGDFKDRDAYRPDTTGYGYSQDMWNQVPMPPEYAACNKSTGECDVHADYVNKQITGEPFQLATFVPTVTGYNDKDVAKGDELKEPHAVPGRRMVVLPVISSAAYDTKTPAPIDDLGCGLMLSPVAGVDASGSSEVTLQFLGLLKDSECVGRVPTGRTIIPQLVR